MREVQIATPSVKLNSFLKLVNAASSGGEAKNMILDGEVKVNDEICTVIRKQLHSGDIVTINNEEYKVIEN